MHGNAATRAELGTLPADWFDADDFLSDSQIWNTEVAERIARADGIPALDEKHWEIIDQVRKQFFSHGTLPVMRLVCRAAGIDRHKAHKLFGSCKTLWRVAGLPNPGEEAKSYMD
ncbi:MAG TPA: TusE/DsrC/DsvC family sulfur relay protein [Parasulfuritortus sp.]